MNLIKKNYKTILVVVLVFFLLIIWASWQLAKDPSISIHNFEDCKNHYPIISMHPARCWTPEGQLHIKYSFNDPRAVIDFEDDSFGLVEDGSLLIEGEITGSWFFEASFLAELLDGHGQRFAWALANTSEDWMTSDLIPFQIVFKIPEDYQFPNAILVLVRDNPSGLEEHDDALAWPIEFKYLIDSE